MQYYERFRFFSAALADTKFYVLRFSCSEELNSLFTLKILLLCSDPELPLQQIINSSALFSVESNNGESLFYHGYISNVRQEESCGEYYYYLLELHPLLHKLTGIRQDTVFLNNNLNQTLEKLLHIDPGLFMEYEIRFAHQYPEKEFSILYDESVYDYLLGQLEEYGAYFYFDYISSAIIFADNPMAHDASNHTLSYLPLNGLEDKLTNCFIYDFNCLQRAIPKRVIVRGYDKERVNRVIVGTAQISSGGFGDIYLSHDSIENQEEADRLASLHAERIRADHRIFTGKSNASFLRPGMVFTLENHYDSTFNRNYMITKINHQGSQEGFISQITGLPLKGSVFSYENYFTCIKSGIAYHSDKETKKSKILGVIRAFIDGDDSGKAMIDEYGRYKVLFPFDISATGDGKSSCWIRRMQEFVGKDYGLAFPLLPGTEVCVEFINGDSEKPVISGVLTNGEIGSLSGTGNSFLSGIRSAGGSEILFDNRKQGVLLSNNSGGSLRFGSDSLDYFNLSTNVEFNLSTVSNSQMAVVLSDESSGFYSQKGTWCGSQLIDFIPLVQMLITSGLAAAENLSEKSSKNYANPINWINTITKCLSFLPAIIADSYNAKFDCMKDYSYNELVTFPTARELAALLAVVCVPRLVSEGAKLPSDKNTFDNVIRELKNYRLSLIQELKQLLSGTMQLIYDLALSNEYEKFNGDIKKGTLGEYYLRAGVSPCAYYAITKEACSQNVNMLQIRIDELKESAAAGDNKNILMLWEEKMQLLQNRVKQLDTAYHNACDEMETKLDYYSFLKKQASTKTKVGLGLSFLPELLAGLLLIYRKIRKGEAVRGGVLLSASDKNMNLHAKTYIGLFAEKGINIAFQKGEVGDEDNLDKMRYKGVFNDDAEHPEDIEGIDNIFALFNNYAGNFPDLNLPMKENYKTTPFISVQSAMHLINTGYYINKSDNISLLLATDSSKTAVVTLYLNDYHWEITKDNTTLISFSVAGCNNITASHYLDFAAYDCKSEDSNCSIINSKEITRIGIAERKKSEEKENFDLINGFEHTDSYLKIFFDKKERVKMDKKQISIFSDARRKSFGDEFVSDTSMKLTNDSASFKASTGVSIGGVHFKKNSIDSASKGELYIGKELKVCGMKELKLSDIKKEKQSSPAESKNIISNKDSDDDNYTINTSKKPKVKQSSHNRRKNIITNESSDDE